MVEILHIDTASSRELYKDLGLNPEEKTRCQKILRDYFRKACRECEGVPRSWMGDGGYAFFLSSKTFGLSVEAAKMFLGDICNLNAQTARAINASAFYRSIRLKAHRGEIYIADDSGIDSADPKHFDDFLKFEKKFAPKEDEFFITTEVYDILESTTKKRFGYFQEVRADSIKTKLYLMTREPIEKCDDIFQRGDEVKSITDADWKYLREHILSHKKNITVRNSITKGLIKDVLQSYRNKGLRKQLITSNKIFELTLNGLYNYLRSINKRHKFSVCYWIPFKKRGKQYLKMHDSRYPREGFTPPSKRIVSLTDNRYLVCQAFNNIEPIATPSVKQASHEGKWLYFDNTQKTRKRDLVSAIQIPVYCKDRNTVVKGVLSIDTNKPNFFLREEIDVFREELIHYLVNLALATTLYDCGT